MRKKKRTKRMQKHATVCPLLRGMTPVAEAVTRAISQQLLGPNMSVVSVLCFADGTIMKAVMNDPLGVDHRAPHGKTLFIER